MDPSRWRFDRALQAQVIPAEHPDLLAAIERLWDSEVGRNCQLVAAQRGTTAAIQMAMGAAITFVLVNEDPQNWTARAEGGLRERRGPGHNSLPGRGVV